MRRLCYAAFPTEARLRKVSQLGVAIGLVGGLIAGFGRMAACAESAGAASWNRKAAAGYLDRRASWWINWPKAARDQGTFCVSCHTAVPYVLSRAVLAAPDAPSSATEQAIVANVARRVRLWSQVSPYYTDAHDGAYKSTESRATEAVLNALVLATHDARTGRITDDTRAALANMW